MKTDFEIQIEKKVQELAEDLRAKNRVFTEAMCRRENLLGWLEGVTEFVTKLNATEKQSFSRDEINAIVSKITEGKHLTLRATAIINNEIDKDVL